MAVPKGNKAHVDFAAGNQLLLSADICFNYVNHNIRILAVKKRINAGKHRGTALRRKTDGEGTFL